MHLKYVVFLQKLLLLIILFTYSQQSFADCTNESSECSAIGQWHLSVALGAGVITNPLEEGKNIPLVVVPYIHYYGEQFFIENNVIGYSFYQTENVILSAIGQLNREKSFFIDRKVSQLFIPNMSESTMVRPGFTPQDEPINKNQIKKRKWAVDAGIQINWFLANNFDIEAQVLHDINNVYQGFNAHLGLHKLLSFKRLAHTRFKLSAGAKWQSKALTDYYYGLDESDNVETKDFYQANSALNPYLSFNIQHKINHSWQAKFTVKKEFLDSSLADSPLFDDNNITSAFIGVVYAF